MVSDEGKWGEFKFLNQTLQKIALKYLHINHFLILSDLIETTF